MYIKLITTGRNSYFLGTIVRNPRIPTFLGWYGTGKELLREVVPTRALYWSKKKKYAHTDTAQYCPVLYCSIYWSYWAILGILATGNVL